MRGVPVCLLLAAATFPAVAQSVQSMDETGTLESADAAMSSSTARHRDIAGGDLLTVRTVDTDTGYAPWRKMQFRTVHGGTNP